jgi:DNA-binding beta-propeller fold protein YncE
MTILTKAATAAAGLALVSLTAASAQTAARPKVQLVAQLGARSTALDASPDPAGKVIYYTTGGQSPAIFSVPANGGARHEILGRGRLLRQPAGLAVSNDAKRLYVADTQAGHILVVPVNGAKPHVLRGSAGSSPRGLELQTRAGKDYVVYSGTARDGKPAVLRIRTLGAARPAVVVKGGALRSPDGVAISRSGAIFVTDHGLGGRALKIVGSHVSTVAGDVKLGDPAGIALTLDETRLLVSSLHKAKGTAQVVVVELATGATSTFDDVIGSNRSAGGLHRARAAAPMGWADVQRPGRIYRVDP